MLAYYFRTLKDKEIKKIDAPRVGMWIHVETLTEKEITALVDEHGLDRGLLEDANDFFEVPRFEHHGSVSYLFTRYPTVDENSGEVITKPILLAVGENFVLTASFGKPPFFKMFFSESARKIELYTTQKAKFFISVMHAITAEYTRSFITIRKEVRESRVPLDKITDKDLEQFVKYENTVNDYISSLVPTNIALIRLRAGKHLPLFKEDEEIMEDMLLANSQLVENGKALLKSIQNIKNAYMTVMSTKLNTTVRTLTALTILLTIPTIVSSLFGMNVPLPLRDNPLAFWAVIAIIMISAGVIGYLFARNKWI